MGCGSHLILLRIHLGFVSGEARNVEYSIGAKFVLSAKIIVPILAWRSALETLTRSGGFLPLMSSEWEMPKPKSCSNYVTMRRCVG